MPKSEDLPPPPPAAQAAGERLLVEALRKRDEAAFVTLVERHHNALLRLAQMYVPGREVAEEVVQETWLAVLQGIDRFEGRSSLKTWIFQILLNRARTRGKREARSIPFSALAEKELAQAEPAVDPDRFLPPDAPGWGGDWRTPPTRWSENAEQVLLSKETRQKIQSAIDALPPAQRQVVTLRDVEGWTSEEVCNALGLSETNQRVLLHRARAKVRAALEAYLTRAAD